MWGTIQYSENWEFINPIGPRVDIIYLVYPRDLEFELNPKVDANGLLELGYPKSVFFEINQFVVYDTFERPIWKNTNPSQLEFELIIQQNDSHIRFFGRKLKYVDFTHTMPARTCRLTNFHRLIWTNFF